MSNFIKIYYLVETYYIDVAGNKIYKGEPKKESAHAYIRKDLIETVDVDTEATDKERETYVVKLSNGQTFHNVMDTSTELFKFLRGKEKKMKGPKKKSKGCGCR